MDRQIRIFGVVVVIGFFLLFLQLNNLQVRQASALANDPGNSRALTQKLASPRGEILAANGTLLAKSVPSDDVYKYQRVYPQGSLYSEITGYFSIIYGSDGVEKSYNKYLSASRSITHLSDLLAPELSKLDNVTLTVEPSLQQVAANALGANVGSVVAIDPATGAILAMYSNPAFNPTPLASHDAATAKAAWTADNASAMPLLDRAFRRSYAPGSTFKVVTSSGVYDHDPALATKSYPVATQITLPDTTHTLHNYDYEACGGMLPKLFQVSCDTGFAQLGISLGARNLATEAKAFGFNRAPPLDLPSPAQSSFPPASSFAQNLPELAYSAIGQENVSATPLEMAMVVSAIADGGTIMTPHVMSEVTNKAGVVTTYSPHPWLQATSASTASLVRADMVGVVNGGTASNIALPGITVAAKTGTAEVGTNSGPTDDWMVAFGPAGPGQTPTIAVAVVRPSQASSATGSSEAGPVMKAFLAAALG